MAVPEPDCEHQLAQSEAGVLHRGGYIRQGKGSRMHRSMAAGMWDRVVVPRPCEWHTLCGKNAGSGASGIEMLDHCQDKRWP